MSHTIKTKASSETSHRTRISLADEAEAGQGQDHHAAGWPDFARVALVALGAALVWLRVWEPVPHLSIIGLVVTVVGGWPIFREAFENLVERRMTMELS